MNQSHATTDLLQETSMFCYQCQEAAGGTGCTNAGVCGKPEDVANLQDLLIYVLKGMAFLALGSDLPEHIERQLSVFTMNSLFATITNANFDHDSFVSQIRTALTMRDVVQHYWYERHAGDEASLPDAVLWKAEDEIQFAIKAKQVGILSTANEDIRSLRELLTYGLKGMAAYTYHAHQLGYPHAAVDLFLRRALAATLDDTLTADDLVALVLEAGKYGVEAMGLLDQANTSTYGHPEVTQVNIGVRNRPGILISGHDLKDLEQLLVQTEGTGVDVYTHSEMLPAHYYPAFKKYSHFVGNYGNAWWEQTKEFAAFNGPILMTTNCIVPPKASYMDRIYTTGNTGYPGFGIFQTVPTIRRRTSQN